MKRLFKWLVILGILVGLGSALVVPVQAWWRQRSQVKYLTSEVSRGRVEAVVNSIGTVKPVRSVSIGAFTSGPISEILVDFNSPVKKGDILAKIDPRLLAATVARDQATLETQKAELARVEALLQQAKNNEERARKLRDVNKDYLSDAEMDQYTFTKLSQEAQRKLALAAISQAEATLKNSEANLGYTEITSPVDGIVIDRKVDPGQTVAASFQTPELFTIAPDMDKQMHIFASVDEADIGLIRNAQEREKAVKFTVDAYQGDLFEGKIFQIRKNGTATQNVVTYPVVIEAPNPELKLMPGMTANISFQIETKESVLRVARAALIYLPLAHQVHPESRHHIEGVPTSNSSSTPPQLSATEKADVSKKRQRRLVWVQDGLLLRAIPVTLGLMDGQFAEVISGELTEGQLVVTGTENPFAGR